MRHTPRRESALRVSALQGKTRQRTATGGVRSEIDAIYWPERGTPSHVRDFIYTMTEIDRDAQFAAEALPNLEDVARFAYSLTRDQADADDLVQETFLRAYRAWSSYEPGSDCRRWLFTICRNAFLRSRERERRVVAIDDPELESLAAATIADSADRGGYGDLFSSIDLGPAIARALEELPAAFREAVELVDVNDMSYDKAAEILGVPIGTIRSRLFRGRRLLQESLLIHARDAGFARTRDDHPEESR